MLYLTADQTRSMIDRDDLRRAIAAVMVEVSAGRVSVPDRVAAQREHPFGIMAVMPGFVPALDAMATKVVNVFPENGERGLPTHRAVVLLVEPETGDFLSMLDGDTITAERTAAGSAVATDLLAREDANVLAVVGTGVQALAHLLAVPRVRDFTEIRVAGRRAEAAVDLARRASAELGRPVVALDDIETACREASVVCATTDASQPVVRGSWLSPGTHVNSVGFAADGPELDADLIVRARVVVELRATAFAGHPVGSHDLREPFREGRIDADHVVAELGELVEGSRVGRTGADDITCYKSAGMAAQDVAAARLVHDRAIAEGVGTRLPR